VCAHRETCRRLGLYTSVPSGCVANRLVLSMGLANCRAADRVVSSAAPRVAAPQLQSAARHFPSKSSQKHWGRPRWGRGRPGRAVAHGDTDQWPGCGSFYRLGFDALGCSSSTPGAHIEEHRTAQWRTPSTERTAQWRTSSINIETHTRIHIHRHRASTASAQSL